MGLLKERPIPTVCISSSETSVASWSSTRKLKRHTALSGTTFTGPPPRISPMFIRIPSPPEPSPYDLFKSTDLTENEKRALRFMAECLHGDNFDLIDEYVPLLYKPSRFFALDKSNLNMPMRIEPKTNISVTIPAYDPTMKL